MNFIDGNNEESNSITYLNVNKINEEKLVRDALASGAVNSAIVNTSNIRFYEELRNMCAQNVCGKYNTNWMCPPAVGSFSELTGKVMEYEKGLLFQTIYQLEDSFDFEGMMLAKSIHEQVFRKIYDKMKSEYKMSEFLPLNAGACEICTQCSYLAGEKCRFPDKAVKSVEACGIDVTALVSSCGIPYNNGKDTVSYVGMILFK